MIKNEKEKEKENQNQNENENEEVLNKENLYSKSYKKIDENFNIYNNNDNINDINDDNNNNNYLRDELNKEIINNAIRRKNKINNNNNKKIKIINRTLTSLCENIHEFKEYNNSYINRTNSFIIEKSNF